MRVRLAETDDVDEDAIELWAPEANREVLRMKHLLSIDDLDRNGVEELLEQSDAFLDVLGREIPKVPALRGKTVVSLFYEESTRTRLSFETAAKRLSADMMSFAVGLVVGEEGREPPRHGEDDRGDGHRRDGRAAPRGRRAAPRRASGSTHQW